MAGGGGARRRVVTYEGGRKRNDEEGGGAGEERGGGMARFAWPPPARARRTEVGQKAARWKHLLRTARCCICLPDLAPSLQSVSSSRLRSCLRDASHLIPHLLPLPLISPAAIRWRANAGAACRTALRRMNGKNTVTERCPTTVLCVRLVRRLAGSGRRRNRACVLATWRNGEEPPPMCMTWYSIAAGAFGARRDAWGEH